ncbi:MAG: phosphatase PAP2 family protein, partial [Planctomycetales bacterium]|nr:phosphatase PAP2 family protein [Planctomycetales bacterium]
MALLLGTHAAVSNTNADEWLQERYHGAVRGDAHDFFHSMSCFGEGKYVIPIVAGVTYVFDFQCDAAPCLGEWAGRSLRAYGLGAPTVLVSQWAIGASRPGERDHASRWRPFEDTNAVSGHAFVGAVPFLAAAGMTDDPLARTALYAGSMLTAISRVNDDAHYTSQALTGWGLAALAVGAVNDTMECRSRVKWTPGVVSDTPG